MGTTVDESSDDFNTIQVVLSSITCIYQVVYPTCKYHIAHLTLLQIPSSWKQVLEDQSTVHIFFDYYEINKPNISKEVSIILFLVPSSGFFASLSYIFNFALKP